MSNKESSFEIKLTPWLIHPLIILFGIYYSVDWVYKFGVLLFATAIGITSIVLLLQMSIPHHLRIHRTIEPRTTYLRIAQDIIFGIAYGYFDQSLLFPFLIITLAIIREILKYSLYKV